jgi:hypothetical protein
LVVSHHLASLKHTSKAVVPRSSYRAFHGGQDLLGTLWRALLSLWRKMQRCLSVGASTVILRELRKDFIQANGDVRVFYAVYHPT